MFNDEKALAMVLKGIPDSEKRAMAHWAGRDLSQFTGQAHQEGKYWQQRLETLQREYAYTQRAQGATDRNQGYTAPGNDLAWAANARAMIQRAMTLPNQQPLQRVSYQVPGTVTRSQAQPAPAAPLVTKAELRNLQRAIDALPGKLAAAVAGQFQKQAQQAQKSEAPTLPISPITGLPSHTTAVARRSVGLDGGPGDPRLTANTQAQLKQLDQHRQHLAKKSEAGLPVSPITGQPSSLTALVRKSVGLE